MIQITCLISFSVFAFEKEQYLVFGGEEEPKRKMSKYSARSYLVCWYEEKKKKKEEGKERLCSQRKSKTEKERGENLLEK